MIASLCRVWRPISPSAALAGGTIAASSGTACRLAGREMGTPSAVQAVNQYFPWSIIGHLKKHQAKSIWHEGHSSEKQRLNAAPDGMA
jgi:hypothetical protein